MCKKALAEVITTHSDSKYKLILTALAAAVIINPVFFFDAVHKIFSVSSPIFIGMALAFVINRPALKIYELFRRISDKNTLADKHIPSISCCTKIGISCCKNRYRKAWIASVFAAYILIFAAIAAAVSIIFPRLSESVRLLGANADHYHERFMTYYQMLEQHDKLNILPFLSSAIKQAASELPALLGKTAALFSGAANTVIGIVISVYILIDKEALRQITQKLCRRFMSESTYSSSAAAYRRIYDIFSRFVSGQITEAFILGTLCFVGMTLLRFDYAVLISFIIGITALVPVVGAIVGTLPCALLLFLNEPISAVWFIIFIIILQQLENNFIYPKIVGKSMGLPPLPVLLAILFGAKIGGAWGILLAVPLTAVIYGMMKEKYFEEA